MATYINFGKSLKLKRIAIYSISEMISIIPNIENWRTMKSSDRKKFYNFPIGDHFVNLSKTKLILFKDNQDCCCCSLKGQFFALEMFESSPLGKVVQKPFLNLYGMKDNHEILMTVDHIKPKSLGGPSNLENYQTLCYYCNHTKADSEIKY